MTDRQQTTSNQYYAEFSGNIFVIQAEIEAVEKTPTTLAILQGIHDLIRHGIRVVLVFGKGAKFEAEFAPNSELTSKPRPVT